MSSSLRSRAGHADRLMFMRVRYATVSRRRAKYDSPKRSMACTERSWLRKPAALALLPWIALGPACVLWWYVGELAGQGDLRPYLVLYAFAFVVPPLLMRMPSQYNRRRDYWIAYFSFALGMVCDRLDHEIFELLGGMISGHTLKHLLMGYAIAVMARMLHLRRLRFR